MISAIFTQRQAMSFVLPIYVLMISANITHDLGDIHVTAGDVLRTADLRTHDLGEYYS